MGIYSDRILNALKQNTRLNDVRANSGLYPSSSSIEIPNDPVFGKRIIGSCNRQTWYRWFRAPEDEGSINPHMRVRLDLGDAAQDVITKYLREFWTGHGFIPIRSEHGFWKPSVSESGRSDELVYDIERKKYVLFEVKSLNKEHGPFGFIKAMEEPKEGYLLQGMDYKQVYEKLDVEVVILYINLLASTNVQSIFDHLLELDTKNHTSELIIQTPIRSIRKKHFTIENIYKRREELKKHIMDRTIPPRDFHLEYTEDQLVGLRKEGRLSYKKEEKIIDKWLKDGAEPGTLEMPYGKGASECSWCSYRTLCEKNEDDIRTPCPTTQEIERFINLPKIV